LLEGALEVFARVLEIARKPLFIGIDHACRRSDQAFPVGIVAGPSDQRSDGIFGLRARRPRYGRAGLCGRSAFWQSVVFCDLLHRLSNTCGLVETSLLAAPSGKGLMEHIVMHG